MSERLISIVRRIESGEVSNDDLNYLSALSVSDVVHMMYPKYPRDEVLHAVRLIFSLPDMCRHCINVDYRRILYGVVGIARTTYSDAPSAIAIYTPRLMSVYDYLHVADVLMRLYDVYNVPVIRLMASQQSYERAPWILPFVVHLERVHEVVSADVIRTLVSAHANNYDRLSANVPYRVVRIVPYDYEPYDEEEDDVPYEELIDVESEQPNVLVMMNPNYLIQLRIYAAILSAVHTVDYALISSGSDVGYAMSNVVPIEMSRIRGNNVINVDASSPIHVRAFAITTLYLHDVLYRSGYSEDDANALVNKIIDTYNTAVNAIRIASSSATSASNAADTYSDITTFIDAILNRR